MLCALAQQTGTLHQNLHSFLEFMWSCVHSERSEIVQTTGTSDALMMTEFDFDAVCCKMLSVLLFQKRQK